MSAWTKKPCQGCDGKKGPKQIHEKYCYSCKLKVKKVSRLAAKEARVERTYGITKEQYDALYEFQGGVCYLCRRAKGIYRRLQVDHDHSCTAGHPPEVGCILCVRGLVCGTDNKVIGQARDDAQYFLRGAEYLLDPPWMAMNRGDSSHVVSSSDRS